MDGVEHLVNGGIVMRLWHQQLLEKLPNNQLKGQHRECCALDVSYIKKKLKT